MNPTAAANAFFPGTLAVAVSPGRPYVNAKDDVVSLPAVTKNELEPLLPRVACGDASAVRECVVRYGGLVHSLARRFMKNESDIEDACQDIFLALWKNASAYDATVAGEATFVAMISRRRMIDRLRSRREWVEEERAPVAASDPDALERHIDARIAYKSLEGCSEEQRNVVLLSASGYSHSEISESMSIPLGTVKSHYKRAIERVQNALLNQRGSS